MKHNVELVINGQTYRIATEYDDAYMQRIADTLDKRLAAVLSGAKTRSTQQALILVALDIIDDYFQSEQKWNDERAALAGKVKALIADVDDRIARLQAAESDT